MLVQKKFLSYLWGMETILANLHFQLIPKSSYHTYEEWKLYVKSFVKEVSLVLILPMRNGNVFKHNFTKSSSIFKFLSYLWGMETSYNLCICKLRLYRSYPTYEEWKLNVWAPLLNTYVPGSYPTYEEWKLLASN